MSDNQKKKSPIIFAVGGAKGGVGKSMVCSNLAIQYAKEGLKVALLDLDFGAANLHTIFGLSRPNKGWTDYFKEPDQGLERFLSDTKQKNLYLLPSAGFVPEMASLAYEDKVFLIKKIKDLPVDAVFLDLGAGSSQDMVDFFLIADFKLLVTTSEPTALMNNYEFIKNALYRSLKRLYQSNDQIQPLLQAFKESSASTLQSFIDQVTEMDSWQKELIENVCKELCIFIIFNQIRKIEEAKASFRLKKVCKKQLNLDLQYPGFIFFNDDIAASVQKMLPISLLRPQSIVSRIFKRIAHALISYAKLQDATEKNLLAQAWAYLDHDFKKNRAESKRNTLSR